MRAATPASFDAGAGKESMRRHQPFKDVTLTEHWDGSKWTRVDSPNIPSADHLMGISAISSSDVWTVGS
jgi:hypothetical protein